MLLTSNKGERPWMASKSRLLVTLISPLSVVFSGVCSISRGEPNVSFGLSRACYHQYEPFENPSFPSVVQTPHDFKR